MARIIVANEIRVQGWRAGDFERLATLLNFTVTVKERERGEFIYRKIDVAVVKTGAAGELVVPYGCLETIFSLYPQSEHDYQFRTIWFDPATSPVCPIAIDQQDRALQIRALQGLFARMSQRLYGNFIIAPCGAGKSWLGMRLIEEIRQPTIIIVHTKELLKQWKDELQKAFPNIEIGVVADGKCQPGWITLALVQTLRHFAKELSGRFGMAILDEAHHKGARIFCEAMDQLQATVKIGLTASERRSDGMHPLNYATIGPVATRITQEDLLASGDAVAPIIEVRYTGWQYMGKSDNYTTVQKEAEKSPKRNSVIARDLVSAAKSGRHILVVAHHTDQIICLQKAIETIDKTVPTQLLHGKMKKAEREASMANMKAGFAITLATMNLAKEGLNAPILDVLAWASPTRDENTVQQAVGRIMRAKPGKPTPIVLDYRDDVIRSQRQLHGESAQQRTSYYQFKDRCKIYHALHAEIHDPMK